MTESEQPITRVNTRGHAAVFSDTPTERQKLLAQFVKDGLEANELCIVVTGDSPGKLLDNIEALGAKARQAVKSGALRMFEMEPVYLPNGNFTADFMLNNVKDFLNEAERLGFSGLRTAGEMTWLYSHPEHLKEAIQYEADVTEFTKAHTNFIGLCLFPVQEGFLHTLDGVSRTHPAFIYDGAVHPNPYYGLA